MTHASVDELSAVLEGVAQIRGDRLEIVDEGRLRTDVVDDLAETAVFGDDDVRDAARGRGAFDATRFTVPAINVRAATYLTARQAVAAALERDAGAVVFEIAKSEMAYTDQRPAEYTAVILAAALREGWHTPVFLKGDHFQFNATKWRRHLRPELDPAE